MYTNTTITKMYFNFSVAFHVFSTLWIDRNTMTIFELFSGLLITLFFLLNFSLRDWVYIGTCCISDSRVRYFKRHLWLTVKTTMGTVEHGAYDKNKQVLFLRKTEGFYPGTNRGNVKSRNHQICSMNRWYMQWHEQALQTIISSKGYRTRY